VRLFISEEPDTAQSYYMDLAFGSCVGTQQTLRATQQRTIVGKAAVIDEEQSDALRPTNPGLRGATLRVAYALRGTSEQFYRATVGPWFMSPGSTSA